MADQPIDKIYIDIEVKNTGLNTLKTATRNLQQVVNDVNFKGIDISVTSNTQQTFTTLSNIYRELSNIQRITSRPFIVDLRTNKSNTTSSGRATSRRSSKNGGYTSLLDQMREFQTQNLKFPITQEEKDLAKKLGTEMIPAPYTKKQIEVLNQLNDRMLASQELYKKFGISLKDSSLAISNVKSQYDAQDQIMQKTTKLISENGKDIREITTNANDEIVKSTSKVNIAGVVYEDVFDKTKNLTEGITKNTYAIDNNGKQWLKTSVTQKQTQNGLLKITTTYDELGKQISQINQLTDQFGNVTTKVSGGISNVGSEVQKSNRSLKTFANGLTSAAAKITILGYGASQIASIFKNFRDQSNAYIENLNLFQVTFGNMADEAQRFADNYSEALGLDISNTLRDMAVFNQIVTGFGVSREEGYQMSKLLTQLSYDLASFMNIDFDEAVLKFQSGIAGELEPLRRVGYALDEATLQQVAYNNGITESIRTMTQQEKAYIRLIAMYEQSENVMGDLAGTIDSPANAMRVLQQQFTQLQRAIGNAIVPIITKLIPVIQGATKALTEFFNMIAERLGYEVDGTRENAYADYMDNITTSAQEAENAINGTLLSFDKFSVLNTGNDEDENFSLPIPDYDALATLTDSLMDTSESFKNTYDLLASVLLSDDGKDFSDTLKGIGSAIQSIYDISVIIYNSIIKPIYPALIEVITAVTGLIGSIVTLLNDIGLLRVALGLLLTGLLFSRITAIGKSIVSILVPALKLLRAGFIALLHPINTLRNAWNALMGTAFMKKFAEFVLSVYAGFRMMSRGARALSISLSAIGFASALSGLLALFNGMENKDKILYGLVTAIGALVVAIIALRTVSSMGVLLPILLTSLGAGIAGGIALIQGITNYATGGFTPKTSGSLFMAGENGRPELMGTVGGKNAVANVNSIETAMEQASFRGMTMAINQANQSNSNDNQDIVLQLDGREIARANVKNTANALSRNYRIELNPR